MKQAGSNFSDNHSTYPTFTMMNSAALRHRSFPQTTGFYGNSLYAPGATGRQQRRRRAGLRQPGLHRGLGDPAGPRRLLQQQAPARRHALPGGAGARADHGRDRQERRGLLAGLPQGRLHPRREHRLPDLAGARDPAQGRRPAGQHPKFAYPAEPGDHERGQRHAHRVGPRVTMSDNFTSDADRQGAARRRRAPTPT